MQREGLCGEIVQLFYSQSTGMIHGDDGYDVTFNRESLVLGLAYNQLSLGLKVSYGIFFANGAKFPTAINVQPASGAPTATPDADEKEVTQSAGGMGLA